MRSPSTTVACLILGVLIVGCSSFHPNPETEVAPSASVTNPWSPPASALTYSASIDQFNRDAVESIKGHPNTLSEMIDLALRTNPQTQHAWYAAQAANAELGRSQTDSYPKVVAEAEGGYFKLPIQFPGQTLVVRNEEFLPQIKVSYDLLDFGRSRAAERGAREQLIAANFAFNRKIQEVVFNVEKSYFILSAANASVAAAQSNLALANKSVAGIEERRKVGLATKRQILLARQVQAQSVYDLENARSMVHDAESALCEAIGIPSGVAVNVQNVEQQKVPADLTVDVEGLVNNALKRRPDMAAQVAAIRANDAAIAGAEAEYYPEVRLGGNYGQVIWSYTVNEGHSQNLDQPFYGAFMTLQWNLFTGFDRYYALSKATAQRNQARADLKALEVNISAAVSKAYYHFSSAKKKYDASIALVYASEESLRANQESHEHGLSVITDLLGAERDLMAARYTLIQNKADLLISSAAIIHAVGAESASHAPSP
jgi:outer membrane protein